MSTYASSRLKDKIALITGASRGIGAAVARRYAREGAHVVLVARTSGALEVLDDQIQAEGGKATLVPLDLLHYDKIDALGQAIFERFGQLDIVVGNAGMLGMLSPVGHIRPDIWEKVMAVNVTANWRLIRSMDALLKASPAGRALFVTSGITQGVFPYWGAYATSKAALEVLVKTYAAEVENSSLKVNLVDPGIVATRMRAEAMPGENPATLPSPEDITEVFVALAEESNRINGQIIAAADFQKAA